MQSAERLRVNPEHTSDSQRFITFVDNIIDANPYTRGATSGPYQFCEIAIFDFLSGSSLRNVLYHDLRSPAYGFAFRQRADFAIEDEMVKAHVNSDTTDPLTKPQLYEKPINHTLIIWTPEMENGPTAIQGQLTVYARNGQFIEGDASPVDIIALARTCEYLVSNSEHIPNGDDLLHHEMQVLWKKLQSPEYNKTLYYDDAEFIQFMYDQDRDLHPEWYIEHPEYASLATDLEYLFRAENLSYRDDEQTDEWIREFAPNNS